MSLFWIADSGFWIEWQHPGRIFNPQSAIQNPQSDLQMLHAIALVEWRPRGLFS
jgi:hypothetical protein